MTHLRGQALFRADVKFFTSMWQKWRMLQIRDGKGEAVLGYGESLPTKEMQPHTTFPKTSGP
jgi:hypothetical protein